VFSGGALRATLPSGDGVDRLAGRRRPSAPAARPRRAA
jgi:hypothetical protein